MSVMLLTAQRQSGGLSFYQIVHEVYT